MKNLKHQIFLLIILFQLPTALIAYDIGLAVNFNNGLNGHEKDDTSFGSRIDLWPFFSTLIGDNGEVITSAGLTLGMNENFYIVPELLRTEFSMRINNSVIRIGRMFYSDPLSFAADGLFDGIQFLHNSKIGRFSIGAWYTGFLYKRNANITMTENDLASFHEPVNYNDFINTYFAPKRFIAAIEWEHLSVGEFMQLNTAIAGQYDLSGEYHSQYLIVKAVIPSRSFIVEIGGSAGLSQGNQKDLGLAGMFGLYWTLPSSFLSRLSFTGKYASGGSDGFLGPYVPITTKYYANFLNYKFSGISIFTLDYSARFYHSFGCSVSASYFVRNDLGTVTGYPVNANSTEFFLGPEVYLRLIWSPFSDLQFNLGGGAFFPHLGNTGQEEKVRWHAELSVTISL